MTRDKLKLEELKKRLCKRLTQPQDVLDVYNISVLSHAEGVAEGAEQEATKIVRCRECLYGLSDKKVEHDYYRECVVAAGKPRRIVDVNGYCEAGERRVALILAPTKEVAR